MSQEPPKGHEEATFSHILTRYHRQANDHLTGEITRLDEQFRQTEEVLRRSTERLESLAQREQEIRKGENFGAEFDALLRNHKIASIVVKEQMLQVTTTDLCVRFGGKRYWIDPLRIELSINASEHRVRAAGDFPPVRVWPSKKGQRISQFGFPGEGPNWAAPHVRGDGSLCLGNMFDIVRTAYHQNRWITVIELLIPFLESCSDEHASYFIVLQSVAKRVEADHGPER